MAMSINYSGFFLSWSWNFQHLAQHDSHQFYRTWVRLLHVRSVFVRFSYHQQFVCIESHEGTYSSAKYAYVYSMQNHSEHLYAGSIYTFTEVRWVSTKIVSPPDWIQMYMIFLRKIQIVCIPGSAVFFLLCAWSSTVCNAFRYLSILGDVAFNLVPRFETSY